MWSKSLLKTDLIDIALYIEAAIVLQVSYGRDDEAIKKNYTQNMFNTSVVPINDFLASVECSVYTCISPVVLDKLVFVSWPDSTNNAQRRQ